MVRTKCTKTVDRERSERQVKTDGWPTHFRSAAIVLAVCWAPAFGQAPIGPGPGGQVQAPVIGTIQSLKVDDMTDVYSSGTMVIGSAVGNQVVILPRNLVIDLPANRLTVQQLVTQAPAACAALGQTGLAAGDTCLTAGSTCATGQGGVATVLANRTSGKNVIVGEMFLEKGQESVIGVVTFINYAEGYLRINGVDGDDTTGIMIRLNDPEGRHTVQTGAGCAGGPNCSADPRFTNDPDNYTFTFATGYPACIPSTLGGGNRTSLSDAAGNGDAFCPQTNRPGNPVADSRFFAPVQMGDSLSAEGNYETVGGTTFLSAHTISVFVPLTTADRPDQPDYVAMDEVEWDVAGFGNARVRALFIGFTTLANSEVDIYAMHVCPGGAEQEVLIASTVGCEAVGGVGTCTRQGIPPNDHGIFKIRYDVDFLVAALNAANGQLPVIASRSPCAHLNNASSAALTVTPPCTAPFTIEQEFSILAPVTRDIVGRSRHSLTLNPGVTAFDIMGIPAQSGFYVNPTGIGHPEFGEIALNAIMTPFTFTGQPWLLGRQFGPGGNAVALAAGESGALDPFPFSGQDPRTFVPAAAANQILSVCGPGGPETEVFNWDTIATSLDPPVIPPPGPQAPIANAGPNQTILVNEPAQLMGSATGGPADTFAWAQVAGDPVVLGVLQPDGSTAGDGTNISAERVPIWSRSWRTIPLRRMFCRSTRPSAARARMNGKSRA
ncbi:MAG: hypothetical protein ACE5EX_01335 [Phycisphaerae bacterium]